MPDGWYGLICTVCFERLTDDQCWVDPEDGQPVDVHKGACAQQAGLEPGEGEG